MSKLREALENLAEEDEVASELLTQFESTFNHLDRQYYDWIQSNCSHFTDHGETHIKTVMYQAGELLKPVLEPLHDPDLSCMEIYVLLSAIIWHDVGMVQSREGHENFPTELSTDIKTTLFPSPGIQAVVSRISKGHTGDTGLEVPQSTTSLMYDHETFELHPRALAAVLRFADEISEGQGRVSTAAAVHDSVPEDSRIYWKFAESIPGISVEHGNERIVVNIELEKDEATSRYLSPDDYEHRADGDSNISLIEYIVCRLEKMNNEKMYCAPEFRKYAYIHDIQARFLITNIDDTDNHRVINETVEFGSAGVKESSYPEMEIFDKFFEQNKQLHPECIGDHD